MNIPPFKFPDFLKNDLFSYTRGGFNPSRGSPGEVVNFLIPDCELLINLKGMLFTVLSEPWDVSQLTLWEGVLSAAAFWLTAVPS